MAKGKKLGRGKFKKATSEDSSFEENQKSDSYSFTNVPYNKSKNKNPITIEVNATTIDNKLDKADTPNYFNFNKNKMDMGNIDLSIEIDNHSNNYFSFKKNNWISKYRAKEKTTNRAPKNMKSMIVDNNDNFSYLQYQGLEVGPSTVPRKKYCDITGLECNYIEPTTGLRYYNAEIFKLIQNLPEPIKNQYLSMRKALFIIK